MTSEQDEISRQIVILMFMKDDLRRRILDILYESRTQGISFKTMKEKLRLPPTSLVYHLNVMVKEKIIRKEFQNIEGRRDYSYYHLTEEAEDAYPRALAYLGSQSMGSSKTGETEKELVIIPLRLGPRVISLDHV
jgi:DNA-binding MarR family transcriptional regulator